MRISDVREDMRLFIHSDAGRASYQGPSIDSNSASHYTMGPFAQDIAQGAQELTEEEITDRLERRAGKGDNIANLVRAYKEQIWDIKGRLE